MPLQSAWRRSKTGRNTFLRAHISVIRMRERISRAMSRSANRQNLDDLLQGARFGAHGTQELPASLDLDRVVSARVVGGMCGSQTGKAEG